MGLSKTTTGMTRDEYLALPQEPGVRVEWANGQPYAMSGGRPRHSWVGYSIAEALNKRLATSPCRAFCFEQRVYVKATDAFFFPDVSVVCPPWEMVEGDVQSFASPSVLVEVHSPSTQKYDQLDKLKHYFQIPTLEDYLLVDIELRLVVHYAREKDRFVAAAVQEGSLELTHNGISLPVDEVFAGVDDLPDP